MTSDKPKHTGKTGSTAPADEPFRLSEQLQDEQDIAFYLEALLEDGDSRVITTGLREVAASIGGMSELARRAGIPRESLYRSLSSTGNPRLSTLSAVLKAFRLRLSVVPESSRAA